MSLSAALVDESLRASSSLSDVRFIGALAGRYALPDRRSTPDEKLPVYACRLCSISTRMLVAVGPVVGKEGETVASHFNEFGILRGRITRRLASGFVADIQLTDGEREKLAAKIDWQKRHVHAQVPDKREHRRILPRDPLPARFRKSAIERRSETDVFGQRDDAHPRIGDLEKVSRGAIGGRVIHNEELKVGPRLAEDGGDGRGHIRHPVAHRHQHGDPWGAHAGVAGRPRTWRKISPCAETQCVFSNIRTARTRAAALRSGHWRITRATAAAIRREGG